MNVRNKVAIGIDLGTTFSCMAYFNKDRVDVIENKSSGSRTTPSIVTFSDSDFKIGKPSRITENAVYEIKRIIGQNFNDKSVQNDIQKWSFKVLNENSKPKIQVNYKNKLESFYPEQISAMILYELRISASLQLNKNVKKAVITVPAYFNDSQRQATLDAGKIAGLNVLKIINEPTAAALAYGYDKNSDKKSTILIYDLGGGTFDVSIMEVDKGEFKVLGIGGDTNLGGTDFDDRLLAHYVNVIKEKYGEDISKNKKAIQRLRSKCEEVKRELSHVNKTTIELDSLFDGQDFIEIVTRTVFEEINKDLFEKTIQITDKTLKDCNIDKSKIDDVVLIGGSTRIPLVRNMLAEIFGENKIKQDINPDEAIAYGAAIQAQLLIGSSVNNIKNIIDIIPKPIGIELEGGKIEFFFKKFAQVPNKEVKQVTTTSDNQKIVRISIYEGEELHAKKNTLLGQFFLENIKNGPAGTPKINCTFKLDESGILNVTAKDEDTEAVNQITISKKNQLFDDENLINLETELVSLFQSRNSSRNSIIFLNGPESDDEDELFEVVSNNENQSSISSSGTSENKINFDTNSSINNKSEKEAIQKRLLELLEASTKLSLKNENLLKDIQNLSDNFYSLTDQDITRIKDNIKLFEDKLFEYILDKIKEITNKWFEKRKIDKETYQKILDEIGKCKKHNKDLVVENILEFYNNFTNQLKNFLYKKVKQDDLNDFKNFLNVLKSL